jgi:cytochrome c556
MIRSRCTCVVLFCGLSAVLLAGDDKPRSTKQLMASMHSFKGLLKQTENGAKAEEPNWEDLQKITADYAKETEEFAKHKSPKAGKEDLWKELTAKMAASGKEVEAAAKKKDVAALKKATGAIRPDQCSKCHDTFRSE